VERKEVNTRRMPGPPMMHGQKLPKADIGKTAGKLLRHSRSLLVPVAVSLLLAAGSTVFTILGPDQLAKITQHIQDGLAGTIDLAGIRRVGLLLCAFYITSALCGFVQHFIMSSTTLKLANRLRADLCRKINRVPMKFFGTASAGDVLSRMTNDVQMLSQALSNSLPNIVSSAAQFVGCLVMMFVTEWRMSLLAIASALLGFLLMGLIVGRSQRYFLAQQAAIGDLNGYVEEMYTGHDVVRLSRAGRQMKERFRELNGAVYSANRRAQFLSGVMQPLMGFTGNLGYVAVCVYGSRLALEGEIGLGVIVAFILYVRLFTSPLSNLAQGMTQIQSAAAAGSRVFEFLEAEELPDESAKPRMQHPAEGLVEFDHVQFGYEENRPVIRDFSARVLPGQKVAIVGPTGAGKTTIVNLLMRFFEVQGGSIRIDGQPISEMRREEVHDLFAMVLQDTWMFQGTVRENLIYNKGNVPDDKLEAALRACGMWDFVQSLPHGLDTELSEHTTISAGQKQLFTIARAMIQNRPMLILDEATSSVDTRTEQLAQAAMDKLAESRTSFVIAHRLSTIKNADLILVLRDGSVVEQGTHRELLDKGGFYAALYNSQFEKTA